MSDQRTPRPGVAPLAAVLLTLTLVPLIVAGWIAVQADRQRNVTRSYQAADVQAARIAARIDQALQERAAILRTAAADSSVTTYLGAATGSASLRTTVTTGLIAAQTADPVLAQAVCLTDTSGVKRAQVIFGKPATTAALSTNVSGEPWFAPALKLGRGRAAQQGPYLSADTHTWVISTTVPVILNGKRVALLHSEAGLEQLRKALLTPGTGPAARVVEPSSGVVLMDSTASVPVPAKGADLTTQWLTRAGAMTGTDDPRDPRMRSATTAAGWRVDVLAAPSAGTSTGLLLTLLALAALITLACVAISRRIAGDLAAARAAAAARQDPWGLGGPTAALPQPRQGSPLPEQISPSSHASQ